jgi:hypothetical protein
MVTRETQQHSASRSERKEIELGLRRLENVPQLISSRLPYCIWLPILLARVAFLGTLGYLILLAQSRHNNGGSRSNLALIMVKGLNRVISPLNSLSLVSLETEHEKDSSNC